MEKFEKPSRPSLCLYIFKGFLLIVFTLLSSPLTATFDSLVEGLGLKKDLQVQTTKVKLISLFDKHENSQKTPISLLEEEILKLHQKALRLQVDDKKIWGDFLKTLSFFQDVNLSVHPAFRKNQLIEISQCLQNLQETYGQELGKYFNRKILPMIGEDLDEFQRIEIRYLAFFDIYSFIAGYWLTKEKSDFVVPCFILGTQLAQAKLIEGVFEDEFQKQLSQQREERRKLREEKEKKEIKPQKEEKKEDALELLETPTIEKETLEEKSPPEIMREEIILFPSQIFKSLEGRMLPTEVNSWNTSFPLEFKEIAELIKKYQTPFDVLWDHVFQKPPSSKEKVIIEEQDSEDLKLEDDFPKKTHTEIKDSKLEEDEFSKTVPPFEIPKNLKTFRHLGIFSTLMNRYGFEVADHYLFLKAIQLLKEISKNEKQETLLQKLKVTWNLHCTQGKEKSSGLLVPEEFLRAFSNWEMQNKELDIHRLKLNESNPLEEKYNHFMKQHGSTFLKMLEEKKDKEAQQLINMIVGTEGWKHHQSILLKKEPQEKVIPLEEALRKAWSVL